MHPPIVHLLTQAKARTVPLVSGASREACLPACFASLAPLTAPPLGWGFVDLFLVPCLASFGRLGLVMPNMPKCQRSRS